jgi:hypothetical protein
LVSSNAASAADILITGTIIVFVARSAIILVAVVVSGDIDEVVAERAVRPAICKLAAPVPLETSHLVAASTAQKAFSPLEAVLDLFFFASDVVVVVAGKDDLRLSRVDGPVLVVIIVIEESQKREAKVRSNKFGCKSPSKTQGDEH